MTLTFKVRRKEYTVDLNDSFMDNGACIQFVPKDNNKLPFRKWHRESVVLPNKVWKTLLAEGEFVEKTSERFGGCTVKYFVFKGKKSA